MDPVQGLRRSNTDGLKPGVDPAEELMLFAMFLYDRIPYNGKRRTDGDSMRGSTISGYVGKAKKMLALKHGEFATYTVRCSELLAKMRAVPRQSLFKDPAPRELVFNLLMDTGVSMGTRAAIALAWYFTLRMGECASKLTTVFNSARSLRREDVQWELNGKGERVGLRVVIRGAKNNKNNTGGFKFLQKAEDDGDFCPVKFLSTYWDLTSTFAEHEPFIRHLDGKLVTSRQASDQIKRHAVLLGLDPSWFAGHSIRIGCGTAMTEADLSPEDKRLQGGWMNVDGGNPYSRITAMVRSRTSKSLALRKQPNGDGVNARPCANFFYSRPRLKSNPLRDVKK